MDPEDIVEWCCGICLCLLMVGMTAGVIGLIVYSFMHPTTHAG